MAATTALVAALAFVLMKKQQPVAECLQEEYDLDLIKSQAYQEEAKSVSESIESDSKASLREQMKEYRQNESKLKGVLNVFTEKVFNETLHKDSNYTYPQGLPNLGNTCYMNSLLQALTGCPAFTTYIDRIWKHMKLDLDDSDSIVVFMLIKTLKDLKNGSLDAAENA